MDPTDTAHEPTTASTPTPTAGKEASIGRRGFVNILTVMAGTLGSRLLGLVRQMVFNRFPGTVTDAFNVGYAVPNLFRELLAEGALVNSFIPVYKSLEPQEQKKLASSFTAVLLALNFVIVGLCILLAPWIVEHLFLPGKPPSSQALAVSFVQLMMPFLLFISMSAVAMGLLNAGEHFRASSFAPIAFNVVSIVLMLIFPASTFWLAMSTTLGGVAQLAVQLPSLYRLGLVPRVRELWHPALRRVLLLMVPFAISTSGKQFLNVFVFSALSYFPANTISGFKNAETLFQVALGLFAVSPALALYPRMAGYAAQKDWDSFKSLNLQALRLMAFVGLPISLLLSVLAPYAVGIFLTGAPDSSERFQAGAFALSTWALAIVPAGLNALLVRSFFVRERTLEPLVVTTLGALADVGLYLLLVPRLGIHGFGLSTAITSTLTAAVLMWMLSRQMGMNWSRLIRHIGRLLPLALLAVIAAYWVSRVLPAPTSVLSSLLGLAVAGGVGMAVYLILSAVVGVPEVVALRKRLLRR